MRTEKVYEHADEAFRIANEAFVEAEKAFKALDEMAEATETTEVKIHRLRFEAKAWGDRWRLCRKFLGHAFQIMWRGQVNFSFKQK